MPKKRPQPKPKRTGSGAMLEAGFKRLEVWVTPDELDQLRRAAGFMPSPVAKFVRAAALTEAQRVLMHVALQKHAAEQAAAPAVTARPTRGAYRKRSGPGRAVAPKATP